jgi:hypothetical protein
MPLSHIYIHGERFHHFQVRLEERQERCDHMHSTPYTLSQIMFNWQELEESCFRT